jgi:hypothetical protein
MKKDDVELCKVRLTPRLAVLRSRIEKRLGFPTEQQDALGMKVWVLPPTYYSLVYKERQGVRAWADLLSLTLGQFSLIMVGELPAHDGLGSGISWTIGKGLLGQAIFTPSKAVEEQELFALVHSRDLPEEVETMSERTFRRLGRLQRRGMSQDDIRRLKSIYGTAVAVPLEVAESTYPFGCVTAHVARRHTLSDEQLKTCSGAMAEAAPGLALAIVSNLDYKPLRRIIDLSQLPRDPDDVE